MAKIQVAKTTPRATDEPTIIQEGETIQTNMTTNAALFPDVATQALFTDFKAKLLAYQTMYSAAADGGKQKTKDKNDAKEAYLRVLKGLGDNINYFCNGNETLTAKSGYPLIDTNTTAHPLPKPENMRAEYPDEGVLIVRVNTITNTGKFIWVYRENGTTNPWVTIPKQPRRKSSVRLTAEAGQVLSGKKYDLQTTAEGAYPSTNASDIFTTNCIR